MSRRRPILGGIAAWFVLAVVTAASWALGQGPQSMPQRGQALYDEHCFRCHGLTGQGDGPEAKNLTVRPANFRSARSRAKTDFELLTIIGYGVAYSPMHAWRSRLTEEEILDVLDYIRTMAPYEPSL
jgi:mono/diheme cytochrome c family protein